MYSPEAWKVQNQTNKQNQQFPQISCFTSYFGSKSRLNVFWFESWFLTCDPVHVSGGLRAVM